MSKWHLSNHITGKTYDLTQENMNAMIADVEMLHTDSLQNYRESLEAYQDYIKNLRAENVRLKNALFHISSEDKLCKDCSIDLESHYQSIAREALKGEQNE